MFVLTLLIIKYNKLKGNQFINYKLNSVIKFRFKNIAALLSLTLLFSCNRVKLEDARMQYLRGEYYAASETYRKYYRNIKPNERALRGVVAYEMADSYRLLNYPSRASNAYANAIRYRYPDTLMYLRYAQMLHKEGKYLQAEKAYSDFLTLDSTNYLGLSGLKGVIESSKMKDKPTRYIVKRMDLFNSNRSEFAPSLANNDNVLYITSSRIDARGDSLSSITGLKNNDIFVINKNDKGEWKPPEILDSEINTNFDEGVTSVSYDGSYLYYTFSPINYDSPSSPKIYYSRKGSGGSWNAGKELVISVRDSVSLFAHPSISKDDNWLYFVSNMPGGYGGKDIWRAYMSENVVLSVENLGPYINTPGDEMFPFIKNDSTLYFSSDGHPGMGGLDIFEAKYDKSQKLWNVLNMGMPINSSMDDLGITIMENGKMGFFSSNRNDARGRDHIYSFELTEIKIMVEGFVTNIDEEALHEAVVKVVGDDESQIDYTTKKDGRYSFKARPGIKYLFMAHKDGYLNAKESLQIRRHDRDTTYHVKLEMTPYAKPVVLENIFYDFDMSTLRPESKEGLDQLVDILLDNPNISIELSAHTDRKGSDEYNKNLSLRRAQAVVAYLIENNIDKNRLNAVGYGKSMPKEIDKTISEKYEFLNEGDILNDDFIESMTEEQREIADQINRRTEFRVIDHNFGLY